MFHSVGSSVGSPSDLVYVGSNLCFSRFTFMEGPSHFPIRSESYSFTSFLYLCLILREILLDYAVLDTLEKPYYAWTNMLFWDRFTTQSRWALAERSMVPWPRKEPLRYFAFRYVGVYGTTRGVTFDWSTSWICWTWTGWSADRGLEVPMSHSCWLACQDLGV